MMKEKINLKNEIKNQILDFNYFDNIFNKYNN